MNYIISAVTDIGIQKQTNQDSLFVRTLKTVSGRMVFAVLCDGMGGLAKGEVASASLIKAFTEWMKDSLPSLSAGDIEDRAIREQWSALVTAENAKIMNYGKQNGINLGSTVVAMLLTDTRYYILNIGDSRAYKITDDIYQITRDQTVVENEVALGHMTPEEAMNDPRRSVLLQCVGASKTVIPDFFFGESKPDTIYMLCSDGFRHEITPQEIYAEFAPEYMCDEEEMKRRTENLIEKNKKRNERDNISVITVRTF